MSLRRRLWPLLASLVLVGFLFAVVMPTRTFFNQRGEIAAEEAKVEVLTRENQRLASRVRQLHTDSEIERLAREQYNLVRPGEEAYAILPGPVDVEGESGPVEPPAPAPPSRWQRVWDSITFWD
ncbi:MAG: septum formation initiator family protein [Actinobacteria bacterium]|nr:septum formation initiator family protein [Actinomycetota bacterium]MBW3649136.1 septum formation initiator family protein [Actinomycetota bacterium]